MAKKKTSKKKKASATAAAAILEGDDEGDGELEPPDEDTRPTLAEALGYDDSDDEPIQLMDMTPEMQEAYMADLRNQGRAEDADIAQSRINAHRRREGQRTAELIRLEPDEDEEGIPIKGLQHTFTAPFTDLSIRRWASKHLGGGKYEIIYYGANHQWLNRERFNVPGVATAWRKQRKSIDEEEEAVRRETDEAIHGQTEREAQMQAQLDEMRQLLIADRRAREEEEKERRHREEINELKAKIEAASNGKNNTNLAELITAVGAAVAPLVEAMSNRMAAGEDRKGEMKEVLAATSKAAAESRAQVMEVLALQSKGGSALEDTMSKMMTAFMMERMKPQQDPQSFAFDMLRKVIPQAVTSSLEMAQVAQTASGGEDNMVSRVMEMVAPLVERATGGGAPQPMAPQAVPMMPAPQMAPQMAPGMGVPYQATPAPMPMPMPMPGQPPQQPPQQPPRQAPVSGQAPPQSVAQPQAGQWPYSQAPGQPGQPQPHVPQPAPQPMPPQPIAQPPHQVPQPGPHPGQPPAPPQPGPMPGVNAPAHTAPAPTQATNPAASHINPNLFIMMEQAIARGEAGDHLAEVVDEQIATVKSGQQTGPALLSDEAIGFMEQFPPAVIAGRLWEACPPELAMRFKDPAGNIRPDVNDFVLDFLHFYFDDDEEEAAAAAPTTATTPEPPATPEAPAAPEIPDSMPAPPAPPEGA